MGLFGGIPVLEAKKQGNAIIYALESLPDFQVGEQVLSVIDWTRRYALVRLHFAAEVVLELFTQSHQGINKIGAHISEHKSRIDFEC